MLTPKIGIIGAGNVGMRFAYSLMISGLARLIVLLDKDRKRADGEALDLASGAPYVSPVDIYGGDYPDLKDCDIVVITAGARQSSSTQTRLELVKENIVIFKKIIPEIIKYCPGAILLVVTNPVDVLSYAAYKISGKESKKVIGSGTVLDTFRLRMLLSRHCSIDSRNIHAYILGEHGDSEFCVWSKAMIGGVYLREYCLRCGKCSSSDCLNGIFEQVKNFAYEVIAAKGETSYGIGLALVRIVEAILKNENSILPVSTLAEAYQGISGIYLSLPCVLNNTGVRETLPLNLDDQENQMLNRSAKIIGSIIKNLNL